jgi:hypothetical protein
MARHSIRTSLAAIAFAAAPALAADFQIFTAPGFAGGEITLRGETPDVAGLGNFHEQASSLVVNDTWEVCTEANYRGECVIVRPGRYPALNAPINRRIGSIRPLGVKLAEERRSYAAAPPPVALPPVPLPREDIRREPLPPPRDHARYNRGAVDLFPRSDYRGRPLRVERDEPTLDDFTDRPGSLVIHEGVWQLCPEPGYRGRCRTLEPGRYPTLRGNVASMRQVR